MNQKYVIDANVLFSAFISGKELYHLLCSEHTIYLPDYAFTEIEKYKQRILKKTTLNEQQFQEFVLRLLNKVTVIPNLLLSQASLKQAYQLCREIDEKDTVYVAVAIELGITLITNDKILYDGLQERHFSHVTLLKDIIDQLPSIEG